MRAGGRLAGMKKMCYDSTKNEEVIGSVMKYLKELIQGAFLFSRKMKRDRIDAYSAQSSFYVLMSFIPFVMLVLNLLQYTPLTQDDMMNMLMNILPETFMDLVNSAVDSLYTKSSGLISGSAIAAVWASGKGVLAITNGLNSVHGLIETRNYLYMRVRSSIYIIMLLISIILSIGLLVFGNQIHDFMLIHIPFLQKISGLLISLRTVATILILTVLFTAMYMVLPNERRHFFAQIPGAVFAALAWCIFSYAFSIYLKYAQNLASIYGGLTTVVMLMLWLYFCMWLLFLGAEINCYLEEPNKFTV